MKELVDRLERATGPSRVLDGLIFKAVHERPGDVWTDMFEEDDGTVWHRRDPEDACAYDPPPQYTSSIDTALSLVPNECDFIRFVDDPSGSGWELGRFDLTNPDDAKRYTALGKGVTGGLFAIALCIAALKARAAQ